MKKIGIYLQAGPACGGAYQYNRIIVDALSTLPQEKFSLFALYGTSHWAEKLAKKNIPAKEAKTPFFWQKGMGLWRRLKLPLSLWRNHIAQHHPLMKAMIEAKCDIWIFPTQDAYAYWMPVPALGVVHDLMHRYEARFPEVGNKKEFAVREFHYQNTCQFSQGVLVDSPLGKEQLIESYQIKEEKCHVLPYIAPPSITEKSLIDFEKKYKLPPKFFFYPAQFWQHKNHDNLLRALQECKKTIPDVQLILVGSPKNHYQVVLNLINELKLQDNVKILGLVEDEAIPEFYRRARALIMPTYFGPTNIPPLEAFAWDCPVAISGIYGMKAQLQDAALYFDPHSAKEISNSMLALWENDALCQTLIEKGRAHHRQWNFAHFSAVLESILLQQTGQLL